MSTVVANPHELLAVEGHELGRTGWMETAQETIDLFARITLDEQWIHVDPERSATGPFGGTIAHGFFTLSLCSHFLGELLTVRGAGMVVNYGLERVRFPSPLRVGSRVRALGTLLQARERGGGVHAVTRLTIEAEGSDKPACVADQVSRFYPTQ